MFDFIQSPEFAKKAQIALIIFYILLSVLFMLNRKTIPIAVYYMGCVVKDAGIFLLAFFMKWFE